MSIIFRNDDVNPSTDFKNLVDCYVELIKAFPGCRIISGVTLFGKDNVRGSVYEDVPFKDKPNEWFYDVDQVVWSKPSIPGEIASHGLFHIDHSKASRETQELSIISSCKFLDTSIFIPPFNRYNNDTIDICEKNGIEIYLPSDGWKSLEYEIFYPEHKKWYFHSWKFNPEKLKGLFTCRLQMD